MAEPVLWIGGWASGLACWKGDLEARYPGREHRFVDAHALLDGSADLRAEAERLPAGGILAAWSLGSLLVHRALAEGWRPPCRILSLCPIFDFCRPDGPWPGAAVLRMIRRLPRERDKVLGEFRAAAWGNSPVTQAQAEAWTAQAATYGDGTLAKGLDALAGTHLSPAEIPFPEGFVSLASAADPLSPAPAALAGDPRFRGYPKGHLPFLDHPDAVAAILDAAA
jgi:hypothetical protein